MRGKIEEIEKVLMAKKRLPKFKPGDIVAVHAKIHEGDKDRVHIFEGTVIAFHGAGLSETITVRKIVQGEGVERVFPLHSPGLTRIVVKKRGRVRKAKLYYLRKKVGRKARLEEIFIGKEKEEAEAKEAKEVKEPPLGQDRGIAEKTAQ